MTPAGPSWLRSLRADLEHMVKPGSGSSARWRLEVTSKVVTFPRVRAVVHYRASTALAERGLLPLACYVQSRAIRGSGCEISPLARIGPGLCIMHSVGIVIGHEVRIGRNLQIYQGVTLGDGSRPGQPVIGDDVLIGAGAAVLGGVRIGDRVVIGAGAVVTSDVPDDMVATGAPATFRPRSAATVGGPASGSPRTDLSPEP